MSAYTIIGSRSNYHLEVEATTSVLSEHNSFDFETMTNEESEINFSHHSFSLSHKFIYIFRNEESNFTLI